MSNGENENSKESENPVEVENSNEAQKPVETENNSGETENTNQPAENATNAAKDILAKAMALKESNPKVFFGGIGAVVLVLLIIMMSSGSNKELPIHKATTINVGQNYVLKGANTTAPEATIRLVAIPGSMAAYDDTEKDDRVGGCKHMPQGTPVRVLQTQDAYGKADAFVQVEMTSGECQGQKGWVLAINIQ